MIYIIIAINLSITLLNVYLAIRIWQFRCLIRRISALFNNYEHYFHVLLNFAPEFIYQGQSNIYQVRQQYQILQLQIVKVRQLVWLINWSYRSWRRT
ncbi:hypothetical protein NIES4102_00230 [Chondrocystis sp. NIES-4102]|nr:hypothetical protein NIES4102_00230 [Chondrocystis sp. NIES-4102]